MICIYRFKRYVNSVKDTEELREWLISNVPYDKGESVIPYRMSLDECMEIARKEHYSFTTKD